MVSAAGRLLLFLVFDLHSIVAWAVKIAANCGDTARHGRNPRAASG